MASSSQFPVSSFQLLSSCLAARRIVISRPLKVFVMLGTLAVGVGLARAEIIDRILAVVDDVVITQSDVLGAVRLGLVHPQIASVGLSAVLDRLIERRLILTEVDRYAPPEPADTEIDRRLVEVLAAAVSPSELETALSHTGISRDQLRRHVRDDLRIESYLQQRFGSPIQPSDQEVAEYYRTHQARFTRAGSVQSLAEAYEEARAALVAERRASTIGDWVAGLRRRANVNVLPR
jgi:hypothetical protein